GRDVAGGTSGDVLVASGRGGTSRSRHAAHVGHEPVHETHDCIVSVVLSVASYELAFGGREVETVGRGQPEVGEVDASTGSAHVAEVTVHVQQATTVQDGRDLQQLPFHRRRLAHGIVRQPGR